MGLCNSLGRDGDNYFYDMANNLEEQSIQAGEHQEYLRSWGLSFAARVPYVADVIVDVVTMPFYLIGCVFGIVPAIVTWGNETSLLANCSVKLLEKFNHFWLSLFGATISPWLAHLGRDTNVALGGLLVLGALANAMSKRTVFAINLN